MCMLGMCTSAEKMAVTPVSFFLAIVTLINEKIPEDICYVSDLHVPCHACFASLRVYKCLQTFLLCFSRFKCFNLIGPDMALILHPFPKPPKAFPSK